MSGLSIRCKPRKARDRGTIRVSGPSIRRKRRKAGFQGLQAHEKKIRLQRIPSWFQTFGFPFVEVFVLFCFVLFCFVSFGLVWLWTGVEQASSCIFIVGVAPPPPGLAGLRPTGNSVSVDMICGRRGINVWSGLQA